MDAIIYYFRQTNVLQKDLQELTRHVEGKGIHAKDMEEGSPTRLLLDINHIHQECLKQRGEATGHHHIAGTPDALVERESVGKQITSDDKDGTHPKKGDDLLLDGLFLSDELTTIETQQHMGYRRDGTHQALWVYRTLVIDMVVTKDLQIGLSQDIYISIIGIAIAKDEDGSINSQ